jgi:hypothetical protein
VVRKLKDPEGLKNWMEGLQKIEHISGKPGEVGAKSDLYFLYKKKAMKLTEVILEQNLPHSIKFGYESKMGTNEVEIVFEKISSGSVKQTTNTHFPLKGFMKIMGVLFKGMFKKQSMKYMDAFKNYVENHN